MYIEKVRTAYSKSGSPYYSCRLMTSKKIIGTARVAKTILMNLGANYPFPKDTWRQLCKRVEMLMIGRPGLFPDGLLTPELEKEAQRLYVTLVEKGVFPDLSKEYVLDGVLPKKTHIHSKCSVGVEYVSLYAAEMLGLKEIFASLGFSSEQIKIFLSLIVARMAKPASEMATIAWLQGTSGLGELLDMDFDTKSDMTLHRACDELFSVKEEVERRLYERISEGRDFMDTIYLYDLTNTYFEGHPDDEDAKRGFSKEKRFDCPLVSLAIMLDWSGFIRKSRIFPGNVSEPSTLEIMFNELNPPPGSMAIMDRGIATAGNLDWLVKHGYRYLVVNKEKARVFDSSLAEPLITARGDELRVYRKLTEDGKEARLYCYSPRRSETEKSMLNSAIKKYVDKLENIAKGLPGKGPLYSLEGVNRRIGALNKEFSSVYRYFTVTVHDNAEVKRANEELIAVRIDYERKEAKGDKLALPGVYSLRTNDLSLSAEEIWMTYIKLVTVENAFRSLKSELGLRPVFHQKKKRIDTHLFISVLAYQCIHMIRTLLKKSHINDSWKTICTTLSHHDRATVDHKNIKGQTVKIRMPLAPDGPCLKLYNALRLDEKVGPIVRKK
jgi:transposase